MSTVVTDTTKPRASRTPRLRATPADFRADFAAIGANALSRPSWGGRLQLFLRYHVNLEPYDQARNALSLSRGTMNYWLSAIAESAGRAMLDAGLWPPGKYFR